MGFQKPLPDIFLIVFSLVIATLSTLSLPAVHGIWAGALFLIVLFFFLWTFSTLRGWNLPFVVPVFRSSQMSEVFLGLAVMITTLAASWLIGSAVSRSFSDIWGILAGLVVFGGIMLVISSSRDWQ